MIFSPLTPYHNLMHAVADTDGAAAATQPPQASKKEREIKREDGEGKRCCEV